MRELLQELALARADGLGAPPMRAMSTVPDLTWKRGPTGPSDVVTMDTPFFIICCASRMTSAPVCAAEPRMTSAPQDRAILAGTSPSTDADTM